jgi:hypothetical protein
MKPEDNRTEKQSLQIVSGFDVRELATIGGGTDYDCTSGTFAKVSGTPNKSKYYCRSIYNHSASEIVVVHNMFNDTESYTARIPSGQWFHSYGSIQNILTAGTTSTTAILAYSNRGKMDATGNL